MARSPLLRPCVSCLAGGLVIWSCASNPGPNVGAGGAPAAGNGGAPPDSAGSSNVVGGVTSGQAGGGQSPAAGAGGSASGNTSVAGTTSLGAGGDAEGGMGGSGEGGAAQGGAAEGGAGGNADAPFDGVCGEGWGAGSSAPSLEGDVAPEVDKSGNWSFSFGRYRFVVAGKKGARIVEFSLDGINLLDPSAGSTFWPSPQQAYSWPPPAELDSAAYVAEADATSLSLSSAVATSLGVSVRKRFAANSTSGVVSIEYELVNEGTKSASWAPWEVTRVRAGGYTFAPRGPGNRTITQDSFQHPLPLSLLPPAPAAGGIEWLNYPNLTLTLDNYINEFDGAEGWLAHANRLGKKPTPLLFVKSFVDAPDESLPENQAEIQLWTSGTASPKLIEVEEQGALQELAPGESLRWTVYWSACQLPASVELSAGSSALAELARAHAVRP